MKSDACQFVVWGHKNQYHTHGHLHEALYRTLLHSGRRARWIDENDGGDFERTIFISHGPVATNIPVRSDAFYMIHNLAGTAAQELLKNSSFLIFGVKTNASCCNSDRIIEIIWATDALPHEIEQNKAKAKPLNESSRVINWVGTIDQRTRFANWPEVSAFAQAAQEQGIRFEIMGARRDGRVIPILDHVRLIQESYIAPTIVGAWQREVGYIPERIFKNISYGHFGVTNSEAINSVFNGKLIQNSDTRQLFFDAQNALKQTSIDQLHELMDEVARKHTYLNRIDELLYKAEPLL